MNTNNTQGLKIYEYKRHSSSQGSKTGSVSDLDYKLYNYYSKSVVF